MPKLFILLAMILAALYQTLVLMAIILRICWQEIFSIGYVRCFYVSFCADNFFSVSCSAKPVNLAQILQHGVVKFLQWRKWSRYGQTSVHY